MKKFIFLASALFFIIPALIAQVDCNDIIYTAEGENIIFDCCIKEVKNGNIVYYTKGADTLIVTAIAITKKGQYIDLTTFPKPSENQLKQPKENLGLYRGHDLQYYKDTYEIAQNCVDGGIAFTVLGVLCQIGGYIFINKETNDSQTIDLGVGLIYGGAVFETIGIPLWISGSIKKDNNQKAIDEIERNRNLSFGITQDGIGIILHL